MNMMVTLHPVDELAAIRAHKRATEKREKELRSIIIGDREQRVGKSRHAIVSDRKRETTDWQKLARSLGATEAQIP